MGHFPCSNWETLSPEGVGIPLLIIENLLKRVEKEDLKLHGLILLHNGYMILEKYWSPRYRDNAEHVFSITKSVISLLAGIAISEKFLDDEASVISYFPDIIPDDLDENRKKLRVKDLLTMSSGHEKDTNWDCKNAISNFINTPIPYEPGTRFAYMNGCSTMVSAIIQKTTGKTLVDYAHEKLFSPIGIEKPNWKMNPDGICYGGSGIWLKTRDIACLGLLLINQGKWNDQQIVPRDYVIKATRALRPSFAEGDPNWTAGYGYYFWQNVPTLSGFHGVSLKGHYCIVLPKYNIVCAATAEGDMFKLLHALEEEVINHIY